MIRIRVKVLFLETARSTSSNQPLSIEKKESSSSYFPHGARCTIFERYLQRVMQFVRSRCTSDDTIVNGASEILDSGHTCARHWQTYDANLHRYIPSSTSSRSSSRDFVLLVLRTRGNDPDALNKNSRRRVSRGTMKIFEYRNFERGIRWFFIKNLSHIPCNEVSGVGEVEKIKLRRCCYIESEGYL